MKAVIAITFAAGALAVPAGWNDADPVKSTTTTTATTWADYSSTTVKSTTTTDPSTWIDYTTTTTKKADPSTTWVC